MSRSDDRVDAFVHAITVMQEPRFRFRTVQITFSGKPVGTMDWSISFDPAAPGTDQTVAIDTLPDGSIVGEYLPPGARR